ncbi:GxxExxY protein [Phenylobacterium sp.]|uniref:GxxExxY protein n=1 Tax=Phenylobacterium sp. TaxID=1871053 RepID=UPI00286D1002|nr:GxxExxY protein [Phenylobacterium sp.]
MEGPAGDRLLYPYEAFKIRGIAPEHRALIFNYLRVTGMKLGLLVNFGAAPKVEIERFAL